MGDSLGAKVGTRVAGLMQRSKLATLDQSTGLIVRTGMALQEEFFRLTGAELVRTFGPVYQRLADAAPADSWVKSAGQFLAAGHGQLSTLVGISGISSGFGQGVGAVIANDLTPITSALIRDHPESLLSVPDVTNLVIKGLVDFAYGAHEAGGQGISPDKFNLLMAGAAQTLAPADILELVNRGELTHDGGLYWLGRSGMDRIAAEALIALRLGVFSVQDLATMYVKGIISQDEGRALAALTGYSAEQFDQYTLVTGEPPDLQTLFLAWRRGIINESDVERGIRQSRLRNEWIPTALAMQWVPMDISEAARAVVQNHATIEQAHVWAIENGLKPELFDVIVDNEGNPPSAGEAITWYNRGLIGADEVRQILREGHLKDKYIPLLFDTRHRILTLQEIRLLYRDGAMTHDEALVRLQELGFDAENAAIILIGANAARTAKARDLTRDQVISLLTDQIITAADAQAMLQAMGWSTEDAQWILDLAAMARIQKFINAAISKTQALYTTRKIDANTASATLDALNIATDARDQYIQLWDIERGIITKELTPAQVIAAAKKQLISGDDANTRLQGMGYAADDALILLAIAGVSVSATTPGGP